MTPVRQFQTNKEYFKLLILLNIGRNYETGVVEEKFVCLQFVRGVFAIEKGIQISEHAHAHGDAGFLGGTAQVRQ